MEVRDHRAILQMVIILGDVCGTLPIDVDMFDKYMVRMMLCQHMEAAHREIKSMILSRYAYQMRDLEIREILKGEYLIL